MSVIFLRRRALLYVLGLMAEERSAKLHAADKWIAKLSERISAIARKNSINDLCECYGKNIGSNRVPEIGVIIHEYAVLQNLRRENTFCQLWVELSI